jgi:membrane-associated phospholipid phosphatase
LLVFKNGYAALFGELTLVILLICQTGNAKRVARFLTVLFGLYACGVVTFMIYPAAGPCLYFPESISGGSSLMTGMANDYVATTTGTGTLSGFGYFIALPSLHILVAVFLQTFLFRYKCLFLVFFPINILLILSTVVLGYHYVADIAAAFVIAAPICTLFFRAEARSVRTEA